MEPNGTGILSNSEIYFSSQTAKAKKLFYNLLCAGHFFCDKHYSVKRDYYDSFLILHVVDGSFYFVNNDGVHMRAKKGETVIIDCYNPHAYYTRDYLESVWVHVSGVNIKDLCADITTHFNGIVKWKNPDNIKRLIFNMLEAIKPENTISETALSLEVYKLILLLSEPQSSTNSNKAIHEDTIRNIKEYISSHISEDIKVNHLANLAHMSVTHFSRVFKEYCGFSPYDYVLTVRLNKAKELLLKSNMSVTEIAYETGFNSEANFVYCFTKSEGISPGRFRKTGF